MRSEGPKGSGKPSPEEPEPPDPTHRLEGPPTDRQPRGEARRPPGLRARTRPGATAPGSGDPSGPGEASPGSGRLMVRVVTGVVLGGAVLGLLALGRAPFFLLVLAVVLVAQAELYHALRQAEYDPATSLGLVAGAVLLGGTYLRGGAAVGLVLFLTLVFSFVWYAGAGREASGPTAEAEPVPLGRSATAGIAVTMLGVAYVPLLAAFAVLLLTRPDGVGLVLTLVGGVAVYDTVAYFAGRAFGRRRLAPSISPGKAIEGTIGATVGTVLVMAFVAPRLGPWDMVQAALLGTAICVMAPLGDLFESLLKRDLGIKDTGMLLPGHGGALDRIDAILFCAPAVYASLRVFGL